MTTKHICMCNELLVFEDDVWQCITPDCETTTVPSTLLKEIDEYNEACKKLINYWKIHHKEYEAYD